MTACSTITTSTAPPSIRWASRSWSLMSQMGDSSFPLVVYMDVPQDNLAANRKDAVVRFLHDQGFLDSQLDIHFGENPGVGSAALQPRRALRHGQRWRRDCSGTGYGTPGAPAPMPPVPPATQPGSAPALTGPGNFAGEGTK